MAEKNGILTHQDKLKSEHFDRLTGLFNLNGFFEAMQQNSKRHMHAAIIHFDVDDFKSFNEQYGFMGGNQFLRSVSLELKSTFYNSVIARVGGDHFIVSCSREGVEEAICDFQEKVRDHSRNMRIRIKAGVYMPDTLLPENIAMALDRAKLACDHIKHVYDTDICYYDERLEHSRHFRHSILAGFEQALAEGSIKVYYQPHVRLLTGRRCGYEALARWIDEEHGMISPGVFIPVLEDAHLIHKLDLYVVEQVCKDIRYVMDKGIKTQPVSVNLSRLDFYLADIFSEIERIREKYKLPPSYLHIEVTESALSEETDIMITELPRFKEAGYELWMDDFGSGYSSLNHLKNYAFDLIKLDMDFLHDFDNPRAKIVISTVIRMAKDLGIHTLCEGVETQEQYDFLLALGCEKIQGFFVGHPEPLDYALVDEAAKEHAGKNIAADGSLTDDESLSGYYEALGSVNVLSSEPFNEEVTEWPDAAFCILEVSDGMVRFYYATPKYKEFLKDIKLITDTSIPLPDVPESEFEKDSIYLELADRCQKSGKEEIKIVSVADKVTSIHMKIIARTEDRIGYFVMVRSAIYQKDDFEKENVYYQG